MVLVQPSALMEFATTTGAPVCSDGFGSWIWSQQTYLPAIIYIWETRPIINIIIIIIIVNNKKKSQSASQPQSVCDSVSNSCGITSTNRNEILDVHVPQRRRRRRLCH